MVFGQSLLCRILWQKLISEQNFHTHDVCIWWASAIEFTKHFYFENCFCCRLIWTEENNISKHPRNVDQEPLLAFILFIFSKSDYLCNFWIVK